ncbi:MAG: adenylate cyclase [Dehalococcoidia bacterium]|nr:MAG: adenylate cyclase [Dehalococcoidia bacterium]
MTAVFACPACGEPASAAGNFCGHCGARLATACPHCDSPNPRHHRFCGNCGRPLGAAAPRAERRLLTVLFADVEGFVAATAGLDPEVVADLMNRYFARVAEAITRFGGTVDKYMGDAVMALFGAPTSHEDDAERAIRAALAIQELLRDFRDTEIGDRRVTLVSRIGIATGEVLYGPVGTTGQPAMTALGEPVNLAARLESVAPGGGVLVSEATYRLTAHRFSFAAQPPMRLQGFATPVSAYLVRAPATKPGSGRGVPGVVSSIVGRTHELTAATRALASARRGRTTMVEISGDAGIGKSRLAAELVALSSEAVVVYGHSLPHDQVTAFGVIRDVLRALLRIDSSLPANLDAGERDVLMALLEERSAVRQEIGRQTEEAAAVAGAALAKLLVHRARSLLIAVFEDLHWADNASLLALRSLVERVADAPLVLVLVSRPDHLATANWTPRAERHTIALEPLDRAAARSLLVQLVGEGVLTDELEAAILARAAGNPFYLEELVRALIDTGTLTGPPGARRLVGQPTGETIPATLRAVIAARIDRLANADRLRLQQAAVLGATFEGALLAAIAGETNDPSRCLEGIVASQLIAPEASRPGWFGFRHPLVREVAYNTLALAQRRGIHRAAAAALQKLGPPTDRLGELLYHLERGEQWETAAVVARRAAEAARRLYAPREAIALYGRALAALQASAPTGRRHEGDPTTRPVLPWASTLVEMARLRVDRAEVETLIGDYSAAVADLNEGLSLAGTDHRLRAMIYGRLGDVRERTGDYAGALQALNAGLGELASDDDPELRGRLLSSLSLIYYQQGEVERAASTYARALQFVGIRGDHREISRAYIALNRADTATRDPGAVAELRRVREALDAALAAGDAIAEARLEARLGSMYARLRDARSSIEHLRRSAERWERLGELANTAGVLVNLGVVEESAGDLAASTASLRRAAALFEQIGDQRGLARALARLGVVAGKRGEPVEGIKLLERAIAVVEGIGAREQYPEYHRQLAELALAARAPEHAEQAARAALRWALQIGNRYEEASAQRLLGLTAARLQRRSEARGWLGESLALFEKIGARSDVELVRRELDTLSRTA